MKLIDLLQGKWLGHPLHAAVVHVPVGAWLAAALFDLIARDAGPDAMLPRVATYCVGFGLLGALLAVPTGIADWAGIKKERPAWKIGLAHMTINLVAAILWAANLGLRLGALETAQPITAAVLTTSLAGAGLIILSGYLGSLMAFDHGVSVARHSKQSLRRVAERGGARLPEPK